MNHPTHPDPMHSVFGHLAERQADFEEHPFFQRLQTLEDFSWLERFIPGMGVWVMTFQDLLEVLVEDTRDPEMAAMAQHIRAGDVGHDRWFTRDLRTLGLPTPTLVDLYGAGHHHARRASFRLMAEAVRAEDDRLRVVLLLALESASYVFFTQMTDFLEGNSFEHDLYYFGRRHLEAELDHGIVEAEMDDQVEASLAGDPEAQAQACALIDRVFAAFDYMFQGFLPAS